MQLTVKLNVRDWPKRGQFTRQEVSVEAADDTQAMALGIAEGQQKWPGGKITAYDVVKDRSQPKRKILTARAGYE